MLEEADLRRGKADNLLSKVFSGLRRAVSKKKVKVSRWHKRPDFTSFAAPRDRGAALLYGASALYMPPFLGCDSHELFDEILVHRLEDSVCKTRLFSPLAR